MPAQNILLGYGEFFANDVPVGLTRGGGKFVVEREFRPIEADGDRGPVKGRIEIDSEVGKLSLNALDKFDSADMSVLYPGLVLTADEIRSTLKIASGDYVDVKWVGKTKGGRPLTITVENAINMGNVDLTMEDKNEVIQAIEYTATYDEATRNTPPWSIKWGTVTP